MKNWDEHILVFKRNANSRKYKTKKNHYLGRLSNFNTVKQLLHKTFLEFLLNLSLTLFHVSQIKKKKRENKRSVESDITLRQTGKESYDSSANDKWSRLPRR